MPKTRPFRKLSIDESLCRTLLRRKGSERRQASLTEYVSEILDWYLQGLLVRADLIEERERGLVTAAKIESEAAIHERSKAS